ncbi:MAG TPA: sulfite exporter TauE/SafE family protein [Virgibacillus sp.]|nr:sulfite exporter TauE/SafE family protein [Virgibacillus sp.]HLR68252.1 sulfite exporter TauE/SafE family protein [Virgibacillus sp.]
MEFSLIIILFLIGFVGSLMSGMLGIGGSIVKYPMLLYIPPVFGLATFTAHEVSGLSAIQVFFSTIGGVWVFRKGNFLNKNLVIYMGISIIIGSFIGGYGSKILQDQVINVTYGVLATIAAIMMFIPRKGLDDVPPDQVNFNKMLASSIAFIVGIAAGIIGAAGAFILVPIMLVILKIPMRVTIATSLAITFISSIGSVIGKLATGQILLYPAIIVVIASLLGGPIGAIVSKKVDTKVLQIILSALIVMTAIKIWFDALT